VEIKGLTPQQVAMLDIMWSIQSKEALYEWIEGLQSEKDRRTAHLLLVLLMLEGVDEYVNDMQEFPEAREVILHVMENK